MSMTQKEWDAKWEGQREAYYDEGRMPVAMAYEVVGGYWKIQIVDIEFVRISSIVYKTKEEADRKAKECAYNNGYYYQDLDGQLWELETDPNNIEKMIWVKKEPFKYVL